MREPDHTALRQFFHHHGLRCTRQREMIYSALSQTSSHPTAEDLHRSIRNDEPGLSLATVYNTLDTFVDRGLCRKIPSVAGNGPSRYDADTQAHAHIILDDGAILDVPHDMGNAFDLSLDESAVAELERRLGISVTGMQIQISGRRPSSGTPDRG